MFPLFSTTHHYRLQHLAHHQFINDPIRDPDVSQLQTSGHWLNFPLSKAAFLWMLVKQLWPPNLIRFIRVRAAYNSVGADKNPYLRKGWKPSKLAVLVGMAYLVLQVSLLTALTWLGDVFWLAAAPALLYLAVMCFYCWLPARLYHQSRVHPVISTRAMTLLRITFMTAVFAGLAWITLLTGVWAAVYYALLWVTPLLTSFSFFMILRQLVQHGNGDRGWLTNTRVFFVGPVIRFSVFPVGQDYHLPHHMFASVPHYRLKELHEVLLRYPDYRSQALEVHGYFVSPERPKVHPTVLDVVGPEYAAQVFRGVHIDNSVLEDDEVEEKDDILRDGADEARRVAEQAAKAAN
jgi:fatty acid desaturase